MRTEPIKAIRLMLNTTQAQFAQALECTQETISRYEHGESVMPPSRAPMLIAYAQGKGLRLTFGMIYGAESLPMAKREVVMGVTL